MRTTDKGGGVLYFPDCPSGNESPNRTWSLTEERRQRSKIEETDVIEICKAEYYKERRYVEKTV